MRSSHRRRTEYISSSLKDLLVNTSDSAVAGVSISGSVDVLFNFLLSVVGFISFLSDARAVPQVC